MSKPNINVTPLIDVLLVLLIIFMVITPASPSAIKARLPQEPSLEKEAPPHPDTLLVTVKTDGSIQLNLEPDIFFIESPEPLINRLNGIFRERENNLAFLPPEFPNERPKVQKIVFIKAPRSLQYGSIAKVIDAVKSAGGEPISLQIDGLE